jgi:hypothetical protein
MFRPRLLSIIPVTVCLAAAVFAQQQTGTITGTVKDTQNIGLPGVTITAQSPALQGVRSVTTDQRGSFQFLLLPTGIYSLTFEFPNFEKLTLKGYDIRLGLTTVANVVMNESILAEDVIVIAEPPLLDKIGTDNSYRLNADDIAHIPAQGRTIEEIATYTPGVSGVRMDTKLGTGAGMPSFRGQGEEGNGWLVDGLATNTTFDNSLSINVNLDAWEEIQIISDGFSPELGQTPGGFVHIITKTGGNDVHGEAGLFLRDRHLRAHRQSQRSVVNVPDISHHQFIGNLGGAFVKDQLWFFVSNNFSRRMDDYDEISIGWLTIPAGNRRLNSNNFFGKLTFSPGVNHTLMASGSLDKHINQTGGLGLSEIHEELDYTKYAFRLNYRGILSPKTLITANIGQNSVNSDTKPLKNNHGDPRYYWLDILQFTNNAASFKTTLDKRSDITFGLTKFLDTKNTGNHELGGGLFYYRNTYEGKKSWTGGDYDPWVGNGFDNGIFITWSSPQNPAAMSEYADSKFTNASEGFGFYFKDSITFDRFSLMLGIRTETQTVFDDLGQKIWSWGLDDFLSPRAALAVDLLNDGNNILKFSYGQFTRTITTQTLGFFNKNVAESLRFYNWIGNTKPTNTQLNDPNNWMFIYEQSGAASAYNVDPDLKPNKTSKFLVEFDRQLGRFWAIKLRGIYSYSKNLLDTVAIYNPDTIYKYVFTNFELKKRDYKAFEVELNGRITNKYMFNAAYTWSQDRGTNPAQRETYTWGDTWGGPYDITVFGWHPILPEDHPLKEYIDSLFGGLGGYGLGDEGWYGFLPYGVDHQIKVLGTYFAPYGFNLSAGLEFLSGYHWEKKGLSSATAVYILFTEGRGIRTTPSHWYLDILVEKDFFLPGGKRIVLGLNVFNALNCQKPVSYIKEDTELFGEVWGRQLPRWLQLKLTFRF